MRNLLLTAGFSLGLLASVGAHATPSNPYSFSIDILDTFSEMGDDPTDSAMIVFDVDGTIDSSGEAFIAWLETPAEIKLGSFDELLVDASHDGIELTIHNSSQSTGSESVDITAYLFASYLDDLELIRDEGDPLVITEESSASLTLDFSQDIDGNRTLNSYGFVVAINENFGSRGTHIVVDATSVPEPSTLAIMGTGLLAMGFVARRKGVI